jgi:F-type H+-transporting ATPase subunit b
MPVDQIVRTIGVNWPHLIAQTISFSIVCALLYGFAYTPLMETLEARRQQMTQGLANTAKINAQLGAIEARRQELLAAARAEAACIITDARVAARRLTEQEAARAKTLGEEILQHARKTAEEERRRLMADAGKPLSDTDQRRLARESVAAA